VQPLLGLQKKKKKKKRKKLVIENKQCPMSPSGKEKKKHFEITMAYVQENFFFKLPTRMIPINLSR
jgi:hypothetical protein